MDLNTITAIARLLLRQAHSRDLQNTGSVTLAACSDAGDPGAIMGMGRIAAKRGLSRKGHFQPHISRLAELAKSEEYPAAQILYAAELETRGRVDEAIKLYEKALDGKGLNDRSEDYDLDQIMQNSDDSSVYLNDAYVELGRLYLERGDVDKAEHAYTKGAFRADDPHAYHGLAEFEVDLTNGRDKMGVTEQWVEFETKAAATGVPEAQLELAKFYSMPEDEARTRTTPRAFRAYLAAKARDIWPAARLMEPFGSRIFDLLKRKVGLLAQELGARKRKEQLNRIAWAFEWYSVCSMGPPLWFAPWLGYIKCLRQAGEDEAAFKITEDILYSEDDWGQRIRSKISQNDLLALKRFHDTGDYRVLDGMKIPVEELKKGPKAQGDVIKVRKLRI